MSPTHSAQEDILQQLAKVRIIPVLSVDDPDQAEACCHALMAGGLPCVEIACRTPTATDAIHRAARIDGLLVGAGTILSPDQARAAVEAGARFGVAPGTNETVVDACRQLGLPFFPGVATPTEIDRARSLGLHTLKVFPASTIGGVGFLKAVAAAYPDVGFVPTGGIDAGSLGEYLSLPCVIACGGSWLVKDSVVRAGRFTEIDRLAREGVEIVRGFA
ncbi:MAG TPA: bifunctional 4-hydroxy-2-oxoglutarate aldolase/2-dehydro-3-deoxy-phosphogluconate aldolase [Chloroflexota bacterium]|jgi:2-dehydro-3-deoxyphosphogluconate aldolase/(4S)-4-hydroxy-2-oxoglutarate aldolase|nr:bifunctional 4-hydroxy-2-oxoglutarate aldolase/2-dehydro-3-deoxy-phosphogluconate aldolase [Chloroflexota bacterium]